MRRRRHLSLPQNNDVLRNNNRGEIARIGVTNHLAKLPHSGGRLDGGGQPNKGSTGFILDGHVAENRRGKACYDTLNLNGQMAGCFFLGEALNLPNRCKRANGVRTGCRRSRILQNRYVIRCYN